MVLGEPVQEGSQGRGWKMPLEKSAEHGREKRRLPWIWSLGATADFGVGGQGLQPEQGGVFKAAGRVDTFLGWVNKARGNNSAKWGPGRQVGGPSSPC